MSVSFIPSSYNLQPASPIHHGPQIVQPDVMTAGSMSGARRGRRPRNNTFQLGTFIKSTLLVPKIDTTKIFNSHLVDDVVLSTRNDFSKLNITNNGDNETPEGSFGSISCDYSSESTGRSVACTMSGRMSSPLSPMSHSCPTKMALPPLAPDCFGNGSENE